MAVYYSEFDTTVQNLIQDIKTKVLLNPDWVWQGLDTQIVASSANAAVGATNMSFTSGTIPAAVQIGSLLRFGTYASGQFEYRTVTAVTATQISWNGALVYAKASGTPVFWGNEVVRTTTVRGAPMILDLTGGVQNGETLRKLATTAYVGYTAPTTTTAAIITGSSTRAAYFRRSNSVMTNVCHVIVSTSKDHIYISVEGPRYSEVNTPNAVYGGTKSYVFMSDLVPYSPIDTLPVVVYGGANSTDPDATITNRSHTVNISKSFDGTQNWVEGVPLALTFPTTLTTYTPSVQRLTSIDGTDKYYLSPYVIATNDVGLRGRLSSFFFAGHNATTSADTFNPTVGAEVVYNGITYKLSAVSKSEGAGGNTWAWGPFGAVDNGSADNWRSPVVAIPMA